MTWRTKKPPPPLKPAANRAQTTAPAQIDVKSPATGSTEATSIAADPTTAADSTTATTPTSASNTTLVIAVRDQRLATLIGERLSAWLLPSGLNLDVHVIAIANEEEELAKVASLCASLGFKPEDLKEAFPTIKLDWTDHEA